MVEVYEIVDQEQFFDHDFFNGIWPSDRVVVTLILANRKRYHVSGPILEVCIEVVGLLGGTKVDQNVDQPALYYWDYIKSKKDHIIYMDLNWIAEDYLKVLI